MNNISDCDGDVILDQTNHIDNNLNSENTELKEKEVNVETTHDSFEADYGNSPINADVHVSDDANQVKSDNDMLPSLCESEDNKLDEKVSESSPVEENNDGINDAPSDDIPTTESSNSPIPSTNPEKSSAASKLGSQPAKGSKCEVCATTVYPMEKVILDAKIYHQNCFRCCKCKKALSATVVSKSNGNLFCKPHYIELFRMRGKYDDIDINKCQTDPINNYNISESTISTYQDQVGQSSRGSISYSPLEKKETISAKDLAKRFQEGNETTQDANPQRKPPIDIGVKNRISGWTEGQMEKESDFKRRNSNNNYVNELESVNQSSKGSVKNLKARFEIQN